MYVSIVINNYNYGRYIDEAISSALNQTYQLTEVIVVDDGSTDDSQERIAAFGDRIQAIYKLNGGQGSAVNAGFRASRGDVIIFLDSDDKLSPDCVESVVNCWRPDLAKLHYRLNVIGSNGEQTGAIEPSGILPEGDLSCEIRRHGASRSPPNSGNAFSRAFLERVMPIPEDEWRGGSDCYLFNLAPLYGQIGAINRPLGCYRKHGDNMSPFIVDGRVRTAGLHNEINIDLRVAALIRQHLEMLEGAPYREPRPGLFKLKVRLASIKMNAAAHPVPSDRVAGLVGQIARQVCCVEGIGLMKRFGYLGWVLAMAMAPGFAVEPLIRVAYPSRSNRSGE